MGVSARALAESAVRAGASCTTVDHFGDLDLTRIAPNVALGPDLGVRYSAAALVRAAEHVPAPRLVYGANLENHPGLVARLAAGRELLGNGPDVLARVREPLEVAAVLGAAGIPMPRTLLPRAAREAEPGCRWLRKRRKGGGGVGIAAWRPGTALRPDEILQEFVEGQPASAVFAGNGQRAVVLGVTRQIVGERAFGAKGFRYCGSLLPLTADPVELRAVVCSARRAAEALTAAFGLRGVCGIDFVVRERTIHVLEVNPRYTASMELVEWAYGISIFEAHVNACRGVLPEFELLSPYGARRAVGKAILSARRRTRLGDTRPWLRLRVRDIPRPGSELAAGAPICTLWARGRTIRSCEAALRRQANVWRAMITSRATRRRAS